MTRLTPLQKEKGTGDLFPPPHLGSPRKGHVRTETEDGDLKTRKWVLTRHRVSHHLGLGPSNLQNCMK